MPIFASNFASNSLSGVATVIAGNVTINLTPAAFALEGDRTFVVKLRKGSSQAAVIATSPVVTIKDRTTFVSLTANTATVAEGNLVAFSLVTTNVLNGATVYYSVLPATANVTADDFTSNTGSVVITNNAATFALQANINIAPVDETGENFKVQLRTNSPTGNIVFATSNVEILDTYKTYNVLTFAPTAVTSLENSNVTFTFSATNVPLGTVLFYETAGNAIVTANTGSFVLNSLSNTFTVSAGAVPVDSVRAFTVNLRAGASNAPIVATSNTAYVIDSALAYTSATGGDEVYTFNGFRTHKFLSSNNFSVTRTGSGIYANISYLIVAGGGGGGAYYGAGAGAGGMLTGNITATETTYTITVGAGGIGGSTSVKGTNGNSSVFAGITTTGGGGGGGIGTASPGNPGGSGAGSPSANGGYPYGDGIAGQGNPGAQADGAGGGGAGAAGAPGGDGGVGRQSDISGAATYYAGGGGGGGRVAVDGQGVGGAGGGGNGGFTTAGFAGNAYTGGGGGGAGYSGGGNGGAGGSGIVIIRYPFVESPTYTSLTTTSAVTYEGLSPTFTFNTVNLANNTLLYYTTVGNVITTDFVSGNTGSFRSTANTTTITLALNSNIPTNEERIFQLQIRADSLTDPVVFTSNVITIKDSNLKPNATTFQYLMVAGGGGSAGSLGSGGGGGGGGVLLGNANVTVGYTYVVAIGAGGSGSAGNGSSILINSSNIVASGGGVGGGPIGGGPVYPGQTGGPGGSGGGGASNGGSPGPYGGGSGIPGQGFAGGRADKMIPGQQGGGGGGAGGVGQDATTPSTFMGAGGIGIYSTLSGTRTGYAGGGGGYPGGAGGAFGLSSPEWTSLTGPAFGAGGAASPAPFANYNQQTPGAAHLPNGVTNTGGGAAGGGAGAGGSGVAIVVTPDSVKTATSTTGSPNVIYANNNIIYRFWQSGSITF